MDILSYLLELLQQSKEVGITGLGTFYKQKFPGRYDKEKQSFLPPSYTLQFTPEVRADEVLVNFISGKRNISTDSTKHYIAKFVEETNKKLELEHEAKMENLGRLFFTEHQGLTFEAKQDINYGSEFYGLPSIPATEEISGALNASIQETHEDVYEEISEAPSTPTETPKTEQKETSFPIIENIELDEVKDDLKNTLAHSELSDEKSLEVPEFIKDQHQENPDRFGHTPESEQTTNQEEKESIAVPEFIKEQHEEHPDRFGHTPEAEASHEKEVAVPEFIKEQHEEHPDRFGHTPETEASHAQEVAVPEFIKEQHEEHPNRFGHTPEVEQPKTYINLHDDVENKDITALDEVIDAPEFIKEQHAEHPQRFGHDPMIDETSTDESKSMWPKILIGILILAVIAALVYFIKPELFTPVAKVDTKPTPVVVDSPKVTVDTAKLKRDSIAKTDSILRANQVVSKKDSAKRATVQSQKPTIPAVKSGIVAYHIIGASFKTTKKAEQFIQQMKGYGISAKIVPIEGPYKKVSIASYKTEKEALDARPALSKKVRIKELDIKQINTP